MSDARPITNVTDFVCGSCWNGFSRSDSGVVQGDQLICPHCGTPLPTEDADAQLANAVLSAPQASERDSSEFHAAGFRDTSEFAPTTQTGAPVMGSGWLPPEQRTTRPVAESDDFGEGFGDGIVVGAPEEGIAHAERTLNGMQDQDSLLRAVRETSPVPKAFVVGEELSVAMDEPTPVDTSALNELNDALAEMQTADAPEPPADLAHRDWKLKAMGITYNFHGLDPLFSWAANKSGQPMSLSYDGEIWKDFHTFYAEIRDGASVRNAFDRAPDPSNAPPPPSTPRVTRTINTLRPELPELEGLRPPNDSGVKDLGPTRSPSTSAQLSGSLSASGRSGITANGAALSSGSLPSGTIRAAASGNTSRTQATLSPSSSPSKRMPVAKDKSSTGLGAPWIVGIVLVVLAGAAVALHFAKLITIPGLP